MSFPYGQATPARQVPGAFLNTPAPVSRMTSSGDPVRRKLFPESMSDAGSQAISTGSGGTRKPAEPQSLAGGQTSQTYYAPAAPALPPLAKAAKYIDDALVGDRAYPELDAYCKQLSSEYEMSPVDSPWAPFTKVQMYEIPQIVFEQYNRAEVSTMMGLFAELNHAWVSIDNCLYLWDYTHPNPELIGFEDNPHSITGVKLVTPKAGIFVKEINYALVVATTSEIFLLGVSAQATPNGGKAVNLYYTRMLCPLRGSEARVIAASANGRIFFAGQSDSDIFELYYQQEEKWFTSRIGKINHSQTGWSSVVPNPTRIVWGSKANEHIIDIAVDDTRSLLYSLSNMSTVRVYHMESPDKLSKVIEKSKNDILRDLTHLGGTSSRLLRDDMSIVSICPISGTEDAKLHLMLVTNTGARLFLSAASDFYNNLPSSRSVPRSIQVQSVKFPPPEDEGPHRHRPRDQYGVPTEAPDVNSHSLAYIRRSARFAPGYFLALVLPPNNAQKDMFFLSAPDSGRIGNSNQPPGVPRRYYEQANWIDIGSRAEDIGLITKPFGASKQQRGFGNEQAVQFDDPPSEFAILTNTGIHIVRRRRLVDTFAAVVRAASSDDLMMAQIGKFLNLYGRVETVTTALAVACGQGNDQRPGQGRGAVDQLIEERAKQVFVNHGGNPTLSELDGQNLTAEPVNPSSRHAALSRYIARLVRALWQAPVVSLGSDAAGAVVINSTIAASKLQSVQENLERVKTFLDENKSFIQGLSGPADLQRAGSKSEELAFQGEHQAMHALQLLMGGISEGISFVQMLFDERVADIYARLDELSRRQLRELTYERLFSQPAGKDLAKLLVKAIVNRNIESGSNVETVADALRRRCGSFCSPDDVVIFRAQEQLKRASDALQNPNTSRTLLAESLRLFQRVAGSLTQSNLETAVDQYIALRYYAGAIQLCLSVAQEKDRGNTALSWINDNKPARDPRSQAFAERKLCYDLIHLVLQNLDAAISSEPEMVDGRRTSIAIKRDEAYTVVNESSDEVFHLDLYEWYVAQGLTDRLLNIESPHVVTFLQRLAGNDLPHADLLCRYYTMRGRFYEAAQVQNSLAQDHLQITLKERLGLLSRAKTNVSVLTPGVGRQDLQLLNHKVTELLEVAHIQNDLLERLQHDKRIPNTRIAEIEESLNGQIQGLSELFNAYADQAGYYDLCLLIYHAADFRNPTTIAQTWSSLIQQTHDDVVAAWELSKAGRATSGMESPPQPYEKLVTVIQDVCHRTGNDSFIFPVQTLIPEVCRYAVENGQDGRIGADAQWPVALFLQLGVSHDLTIRLLERVFEAQEVPFRGAGRTRVVEWITGAVNGWVKEVGRRGGNERGLEPWVGDLMAECGSVVRTARSNEGGLDVAQLVAEVAEVKRNVDSLVSGVGRGSFGGSLGFL